MRRRETKHRARGFRHECIERESPKAPSSNPVLDAQSSASSNNEAVPPRNNHRWDFDNSTQSRRRAHTHPARVDGVPVGRVAFGADPNSAVLPVLLPRHADRVRFSCAQKRENTEGKEWCMGAGRKCSRTWTPTGACQRSLLGIRAPRVCLTRA